MTQTTRSLHFSHKLIDIFKFCEIDSKLTHIVNKSIGYLIESLKILKLKLLNIS